MAILADLGQANVDGIREELEELASVLNVETVCSYDEQPVYFRVTVNVDVPKAVGYIRHKHGLKWGSPRIDSDGDLVVTLGVPNDDLKEA